MSGDSVIVALSGGVDSAVAALLLRDAGYAVECLHMTNWEDDGYCDAAAELQDAARVCKALGLPLHRVNFAREYREQVFAEFLRESEAGRTPNPDVLCNREIKFGVMRRYARRLGARRLATGHYARLESAGGTPALLKGADSGKDQSYFLHAVETADFEDVLFPLGRLQKSEVRALARRARLEISEKKDSTGICFIGERPFAEFLSRYVSAEPGLIKDCEGRGLGEHRGLALYTLGQRQGLRIGGRAGSSGSPWYVAEKRIEDNELIVVQGAEHPLLYSDALTATGLRWIGAPPAGRAEGSPYRCRAKTRYRQPDQACTLVAASDFVEVRFDVPQRAVTPGQHVVVYDGDRCLGGATIERGLRNTL
ncbi:MAG TPA: tRNA 2-thiouridine(34) synthase MnmA [Gammaproteobacteria bacterium]|nr:tRNA 2-thiouridine(34) synthase MnmA [Gammaproteobacteria bacterium]